MPQAIQYPSSEEFATFIAGIEIGNPRRGYDAIPALKIAVWKRYGSKFLVKLAIECSNVLSVWYPSKIMLDKKKYDQQIVAAEIRAFVIEAGRVDSDARYEGPWDWEEIVEREVEFEARERGHENSREIARAAIGMDMHGNYI